MSRRVVNVGERVLVLGLDDPAPQRSRFSVLVSAQLRDEVSGAPVPVAARVRPAGAAFAADHVRAQLRLHNGADGIVGVSAHPSTVCPDAGVVAYEVGFEAEVDGYHQREVLATYGPFVADWRPTSLGSVALHRLPVRMGGSVMQRTMSGLVPVGGATVRIAGYRLTLSTPAAPVLLAPPQMLALERGLYAARVAGVAALRPIQLDHVPATRGALGAPAPAGARELRVSDTSPWLTADLVTLDEGLDGSEETVLVTALDGLRPGHLRLAHALRRGHDLGAAVVASTRLALAPPITLTVDGLPGDQTVLTDPLGVLIDRGHLELEGGAAREYHAYERYTAQSDAGGFYRMPALDRVAEVRIVVDAGPLGAALRDLSFTVGTYEQTVDFELI